MAATTIERVPAHDLKVGDEVIVDGLQGDYRGRIVAIDEYTVRHAVPLSRFDTAEANGHCLCIRLPYLNTYRGLHDTLRRVVKSKST